MTTSAVLEKKLYIGGLDPSITLDEISGRFSRFGTVSNCSLPQQKNPNVAYAFLTLNATSEMYQKCCSIYHGTQWKGHILSISEAKQHWSTTLEREQNEIKRNHSDHNGPKKLSKSKLKKLAVTMAIPMPYLKRKGWIKLKDRILPVIKLRSIKTGRVIKMDPTKYPSSYTKFNLDALLSSTPMDFNIERTAEQLERQRKRAGRFTQEEIAIGRKSLKANLKHYALLIRESYKTGKSIKKLMEEEERMALFKKERGSIMQILDALFDDDETMPSAVVEFEDDVGVDMIVAQPKVKMDGVVEFSDEENMELPEAPKGGLFDSESDHDELFETIKEVNGPMPQVVHKTKRDMLALFSSSDDEEVTVAKPLTKSQKKSMKKNLGKPKSKAQAVAALRIPDKAVDTQDEAEMAICDQDHIPLNENKAHSSVLGELSMETETKSDIQIPEMEQTTDMQSNSLLQISASHSKSQFKDMGYEGIIDEHNVASISQEVTQPIEIDLSIIPDVELPKMQGTDAGVVDFISGGVDDMPCVELDDALWMTESE